MIVERPECDKIAGFHFGTVLWQLPHGKLKVFIHGVYPEEFLRRPECLPTAVQMTPLFAGNSIGDGCFSYPNIGATVICSFLNGDQNMPIVLGAIQGGSNAYNQYNYVKEIGELSADRHMITTGNTHVRFHDDGQLNVFVQRPFDNTASVDFSVVEDASDVLVGNWNLGLSGRLESLEKTGITEPVKQAIADHQTSCVNCRFSINDTYGTGAISAGEHFYDYAYDSAYWQPIIMSSFATSSMQSISQHELSNQLYNNQFAKLDLSSFASVESSFNSADYWMKTTYTSNYKNAQNASTRFDQVLNDATVISNGSQILSSYDHVDTALSIFKSSNFNQTDMAWAVLSSGNGNSFGVIRDSESIRDTIVFENTHASSIIETPLSGMNFDAKYDYSLTAGKSKTQIKGEYFKHVDLVEHPSVKESIVCEKTLYSSRKYNVECREFMDAENGYIELYIRNNEDFRDCLIRMNKRGFMDIDATEELTIHAKKISITGDDINIQSRSLDMTGSSGDCQIGSVSLLKHVHMETQSGDVVSPAPTKSAQASN